MTPDAEPRPVLRVVRGDASPEEVAALVAVLAASGARTEATDAGRSASRDAWTSHARSASMRLPLVSGPKGWRASGLPR